MSLHVGKKKRFWFVGEEEERGCVKRKNSDPSFQEEGPFLSFLFNVPFFFVFFRESFKKGYSFCQSKNRPSLLVL